MGGSFFAVGWGYWTGSGGFFREEAADEVAFPHPESGEDEGGEEDEAGGAGVLGEVFEGAVDVADDGDGQEENAPASEAADAPQLDLLRE